MSRLSVIVADDFAPWRHFVASTIQGQPELHIVAEASDGLEALQKATELQPDLILLDIDLPRLNGIEAATRIKQSLPDVKILFLSQINDPEVVGAALSSGGQGYVLKAEAGSELTIAINAVLRGGGFVSRRLTGQVSEDYAVLASSAGASWRN